MKELIKDKTTYDLDEKQRQALLTEEGSEKIEQIWRRAAISPRTRPACTTPPTSAWSTTSTRRCAPTPCISRDKDYIIKAGEVVLIDEFTGRMMTGRRLSEGLHQAIEAKEGVKIMPENQTLASVTIQNYFRLYEKLSGMTGTAATEAQEFLDIYKMDVLEVPTNRPDQAHRPRRRSLSAPRPRRTRPSPI